MDRVEDSISYLPASRWGRGLPRFAARAIALLLWSILTVLPHSVGAADPANQAGGEPAAGKARTEVRIDSASGTTQAVPSDVAAILGRAQALVDEGRYEKADILVSGALESASLKKDEREQLQAALQRIGSSIRQLNELAELRELRSHGRGDEVSTRLHALALAANDSRVRKQAAEMLEHKWEWTDGYVGTARKIIVIVALMLLLYIVRAALACIFCYRRARFSLAPFSDSTGLDLGRLVFSYAEYWQALSRRTQHAGLYVMEASSLPESPSLRLAERGESIAEAFSLIDLDIAGASVSIAIRAIVAVWRWCLPQPTEIQGLVRQDSTGQIFIRLSVRPPWWRWWKKKEQERSLVVSASAHDSSEDAAHAVSKEVSFKMLYAIAVGAVDAAQLANDIRVGLDELRSYLTGADSSLSKLEKSRATFERVRTTDPQLLEARLYEGIALDLLERHEEAAAQFSFIKASIKNATSGAHQQLLEQAQYNEAVAQLRNLYGLKPIEDAISLLNLLLGKSPNLREKPIHALATITLADAWANKTIHWTKLVATPDLASFKKLLASHESEVQNRVTAVQAALGQVDAEIKKGDSFKKSEATKGWNVDSCRQIQWGIHNTLADLQLYAAVELAKLDAPYQKELESAIDELHNCEILFPPGVETLSNAGTAFLLRGRPADVRKAREYLTRAIKLNDKYEYAYYRLAQAWEKEQWREKVVETLKSFPTHPEIPEFYDMYRKYFVMPTNA